uniref:Si:ch73-343l4.8 n=1 Tax=Sinocyclocheilus rhinocerous TaxID=307959 RepID=A0A673KUI3_9TELE
MLNAEMLRTQLDLKDTARMKENHEAAVRRKFNLGDENFLKSLSSSGYLWGPDGLFLSSELKSWSDSRQYCRDRGADLVIINTEEKLVSLCECLVWIGLSDTENEGIMKWVDNSPLNQGFWRKSEPNNYGGNEDCIELNYKREETGWSPLNSWNDVPCSETKKGICEK